MSKKIILEIKELAKGIENSSDLNISELKQKVSVLYDKLTILEFLEESISVVENIVSVNTTVEIDSNKTDVVEEIIETPESVTESLDFIKSDEVAVKEVPVVTNNEVVNEEQKIEHQEKQQQTEQEVEYKKVVEEEVVVSHSVVVTSSETVKDEEQVQVDIIEEKKVIVEKIEVSPLNTKIEDVKVANTTRSLHETFDTKKSSLHEELKKDLIQIGLNDRIAFVKRLFDGSQQDFHRVLSQVNTFATIDEVREFIDTMVRPEHNWDNQEEYAQRFMEIIEVRFQ